MGLYILDGKTPVPCLSLIVEITSLNSKNLDSNILYDVKCFISLYL